MTGTDELFTVDGGIYGPYAASPVRGPLAPDDAISVTRATAEQIAYDLNVRNAGCGLTAAWDGPDLVFTWDWRYRADRGSKTVTPESDGRYRIGGLWSWTRDDANHQAIRALAAWGISWRFGFDDAGHTSLIIDRRQDVGGFRSLEEPRLLLGLYNEANGEIANNRLPGRPRDCWRAVTVDGNGDEQLLTTRPAAQLAQCVEAIAEWLTSPQG